eukprot:1022532-Prymnesium_polylepis.1
MHDLAEETEKQTCSHSKVFWLGKLLDILRERLRDGEVTAGDILGLRGVKGVGKRNTLPPHHWNP